MWFTPCVRTSENFSRIRTDHFGPCNSSPGIVPPLSLTSLSQTVRQLPLLFLPETTAFDAPPLSSDDDRNPEQVARSLPPALQSSTGGATIDLVAAEKRQKSTDTLVFLQQAISFIEGMQEGMHLTVFYLFKETFKVEVASMAFLLGLVHTPFLFKIPFGMWINQGTEEDVGTDQGSRDS